MGDPRTKKNSARVVTVPYPRVLPSKAYTAYEKDCLKQLDGVDTKYDGPVNVRCVYFMKTHRKIDLVNLQEATLDILCEAGILSDDNSRIVVSMDGSRVDFDKVNPRVEIDITEVPHADQ